MPRSRHLSLALVLCASVAGACLWDSETIYVERIGFPSDIQLIVGAVHVRSDSFHLWRKAYSLRRIADSTKAKPEDYDNLAVSLDKLHNDDSAISVMLSKRQRYGLTYETMANLGTFHFHRGQFAQGLPYLDSALELNPQAHFGRERYQKWLVEYLQDRPQGRLPMTPARSKHELGRIKGEHGYAAYVAQKEGMGKLSDSARAKAIAGILGMMRFGNGNHPILLEAYADLALGRKDPYGRGLAVKAYLMAARKSSDSTMSKGYELLASLVPKNSASVAKHRDDLWNYGMRVEFREYDYRSKDGDYHGRKLREMMAGSRPIPWTCTGSASTGFPCTNWIDRRILPPGRKRSGSNTADPR